MSIGEIFKANCASFGPLARRRVGGERVFSLLGEAGVFLHSLRTRERAAHVDEIPHHFLEVEHHAVGAGEGQSHRRQAGRH